MLDVQELFRRFKRYLVAPLLIAQVSIPAFTKAANEVSLSPEEDAVSAPAHLSSEERLAREELAVLRSYAMKEGATSKQAPLPVDFSEFKGRTYAESVILQVVKTNPKAALTQLRSIGKEPYYERICAALFQEDILLPLTNESPSLGFKVATSYLEKSPLAEKILRKVAKEDPFTILSDYKKISERPYAEELLREAQKSIPDLFVLFKKSYFKEPFGWDVFKQSVADAPAEFYRSLSDNVESGLSPEQKKETRKIAKNSLRQKILGGDRDMALQLALYINEGHDLPDAERFGVVSDFSAKELYNLISLGREEVYTSTYLGLVTRFLGRVKTEGTSINEIALSEDSGEKLPVFIEAAATYGRVGDLFNSLEDKKERERLLRAVFDAAEKTAETPQTKDDAPLSKTAPIRMATSLALIMQKLDSPPLLARFQDELLKRYDASFGVSRDMFGFVAAALCREGKNIGEEPFAKRQIKKLYPIDPLKRLKDEDLFVSGKCYERMIFHDGEDDDKDAKASFAHFVGFCKSKQMANAGWRVEDRDGFVVVSSSPAKNGTRQIVIVANKPERQKEGQQAVSKFLEDKKVSVVIHRGHSTYVGNSLPFFTEDNKIVFLGSCGGAFRSEEIGNALKEAQIVATRGVGSMLVNDPLLFIMNRNILETGEADWDKIWEQAKKSIPNDKFGDYISPHDNLGVSFVRSFGSLSSIDAVVAGERAHGNLFARVADGAQGQGLPTP